MILNDETWGIKSNDDGSIVDANSGVLLVPAYTEGKSAQFRINNLKGKATLVAALNAAQVCITDDDALEFFQGEFDFIGSAAMCKKYGIEATHSDDLAVEFMAFSNDCMYWTKGY